jgi:hypothetical protein
VNAEAPAPDAAGAPPVRAGGDPPRRIVSLAARPDLADAVPALLATQWPAFMLAGRPGHDVDLPTLLRRLPEHQVLVLGPDDEILCAGLSAPVRWDGTPGGLPSGWDGAVTAAARRYDAGGPAEAVCALSITVAAGAAGRGLAGDAFGALKAAAANAGATSLIGPVRPVRKADYPLIPMAEYLTWRTPDGSAFDPWLRLHQRWGGTVAGMADPAMTVSGTVADWEAWTGLPLPASGEYVIPGGLAPLRVDRASDEGIYQEANVWVVHPTRAG